MWIQNTCKVIISCDSRDWSKCFCSLVPIHFSDLGKSSAWSHVRSKYFCWLVPIHFSVLANLQHNHLQPRHLCLEQPWGSGRHGSLRLHLRTNMMQSSANSPHLEYVIDESQEEDWSQIPSTLPCGTPHVTADSSEQSPSTTTQIQTVTVQNPNMCICAPGVEYAWV